MLIGNIEVYGIIYKITNRINGKVYIGQTIRPFDMRYSGGNIANTCNTHLQSSINKYGVENFSVVKIFDIAFSKVELDIKEDFYITLYNSSDRRFGYNKQSGGANGVPTKETRKKQSEAHKGKGFGKDNPFFGKRHTEETLRKISEANKGRRSPMKGKHHTEEAKRSNSIKHSGENHPNFGKHLSEETRSRISKARMGHGVSEETRMKISKSLIGKCSGSNNPKSKPIECIETGEVFPCARDACTKYGINPANMSAHLNGRRKSVKKLHFKFTNND